MTPEQVKQMVDDIAATIWFYQERQGGITAVRVTIVAADDKRRVLDYPEDER